MRKYRKWLRLRRRLEDAGYVLVSVGRYENLKRSIRAALVEERMFEVREIEGRISEMRDERDRLEAERDAFELKYKAAIAEVVACQIQAEL